GGPAGAGAGSRRSGAQPASSVDKNTAARRRALERISAGLAQLHLEFHLHVGADDIGLRPLARADAERAALHSQLAFHHGAVGGSRPAERHFDIGTGEWAETNVI